VKKVEGKNLCDRCLLSTKMVDTSSEEKYVDESKARLRKHRKKNKYGGLEKWIYNKIRSLITEKGFGVYMDESDDDDDVEMEIEDELDEKHVEEEFEVIKIHSFCALRNKFSVEWRGYEELTWEPYENLNNCEELLREFFRS
jgi:hypothetical protein